MNTRGNTSIKPCPHCRKKVRLSQKTATRQIRRQSHFSATVQSHFSATVWTGLKSTCTPVGYVRSVDNISTVRKNLLLYICTAKLMTLVFARLCTKVKNETSAVLSVTTPCLKKTVPVLFFE